MYSDIVKYVQNNHIKTLGITGGAGVGKTSLSNRLGGFVIHVDDFFIGNSKHRSWLLNKKVGDRLVDAQDQYNWWNWDLCEQKIHKALSYNNLVIVEGALLGPPSIPKLMDKILYLDASTESRRERLWKRDYLKRTPEQFEERFNITNQSEKNYYEGLFSAFQDKILVLDDLLEFSYLKRPIHEYSN
jgi:uridine kinase